MRDDRPGCLVGLLQLFLLKSVTDWLQERFGFGRGCSCTGIGCGVIITLVSAILFCSILTGTDWFQLFSLPGLPRF